jgi:hypothetical protein
VTIAVLRLPASAVRGGHLARVAVTRKPGASNAYRVRLAVLGNVPGQVRRSFEITDIGRPVKARQ